MSAGVIPQHVEASMRILGNLGAALLVLGAMATSALAATPQDRGGSSMESFRTDRELRTFLRSVEGYVPPPPAPPPPPPVLMSTPVPSLPTTSAPVASTADVAANAAITVTGNRVANPSITNTQEANVDEGGIVKVAGDYLVILRRGRLFSVSTADQTLRPVAHIDAFPPGTDGSGDWYDEMLINGDQIIVVGYSYARGGTEINRFRIGPDGSLTYRDSYHLKSDDYYSSRNYASRLIGDQLILYSPLYLENWRDGDDDVLDQLPGLSRWQPGQAEPVFRRMVTAREVYAPQPLRTRQGRAAIEAMHTVTRCNVAAEDLTCQATVVLGQEGRSFYVSSDAVYVWLSSWSDDDGEESASSLYRIPLNRGRPQAIQTRGSPVDQFSFRADERARRLDVLVVSEGGGDAMWRPEFAFGTPALLQLDLRRMNDGRAVVPISAYRLLPTLGGNAQVEHNRFIGSNLLYAQSSWSSARTPPGHLLGVVPLDGGAVVNVPLGGQVGRIEQLGSDGLVVAQSGTGTEFVTIDLSSGRSPDVLNRYALPAAREGESRSHAFFFRPDNADGSNGLMGLPVMRQERRHNSLSSVADMQFLRRQTRVLDSFGQLTGQGGTQPIDDCQASCADWYGNSRPIFLGNRVFALMGYELVEGDASGAAIREVRRINFTPVTHPVEGKSNQ